MIFSDRQWTSANGLSLFARDYPGAGGEARLPVICLHGLTRNSSDFEEIAPTIASFGRRVIAPDIRGRGHSQWDSRPENYVPQTYARDLTDLLDALGIAKAVFIGTSMGGIIMMTLALRQRNRIAAAVLNDVGPEVSPEGLERIQSYVGRPVMPASWAEAVAYVRQVNEVAFPNFTEQDWERMTERAFSRGPQGPVFKVRSRDRRTSDCGKGKGSQVPCVAYVSATRESPACPGDPGRNLRHSERRNRATHGRRATERHAGRSAGGRSCADPYRADKPRGAQIVSVGGPLIAR